MFALCMLQVSIQKKGSGQGACGWLAETLPAPFSVRKNFGVATQTLTNVHSKIGKLVNHHICVNFVAICI